MDINSINNFSLSDNRKINITQDPKTNKSDGNSSSYSLELSDESIKKTDDNKASSKSYNELDQNEKKQVDELKKTDREVRAHEQAHLSASGGLAVSGANFEYETGPDGKKYAVGGEVHIDTSEGKDPKDTIKRAEKIKRAALAPANPSSQDRSVAAKASSMEAKAKMELAKQKYSQNSSASHDTQYENQVNVYA